MITKLSETPGAKISVREDAVEVPDDALQRADFDRDNPAFSRFKVESQQFQWSEYEVRNCRLLIHRELSGILFLEDGTAVVEQFPNSIPRFIKHHLEHLYVNARENGELPDKGELDEVFIPFDKEWFNHYHLNIIALPKVSTYLRDYRPDIKVVLPDIRMYLPDNLNVDTYMSSLLTQSDIDSSKIQTLSPGLYTVKCARLLIPNINPLLTVHGELLKEHFGRTRRTISDAVNQHKEDHFFSRSGATNKRAQDTSESLAVDSARELHPSLQLTVTQKLSMQQQFSMVQSSNSLSGMHGAALANMMFSDNDSLTLTEYNLGGQTEPIRPHFYHLAVANGYNYRARILAA